ncbi:MAG: ParB/RepB/Spo0J family partition protein [Firmicutes bacterium]|nr:ParB/RepB/Spo0J family partition protein [Bacillota bacterium]
MDTTKRRALGKGLEELFNNEQLDFNKIEEKIIDSTPKEEIVEVNLDELRSNPYQPRKVFDEEKLNELADSIKEHGVFQPIIVKKSIKGYEIIAGERRVKASQIAGKETIPAIIRDFSDEAMMEIALLENLQRENLNSIEEANAYKKLLDTLNLTQEELAKRLGKSRSHITNMLGLLNLPEEVKNLINEDKISMSHARVLSKIEDKEKIDEFVSLILNENISVRQIEELARNENVEKTHKVNRKSYENEYSYLEDELSDKLGTRVKIKKNKVEITFTNNSDLNRILEIMNLND